MINQAVESITRRIAAEGAILLKNDGTLPLAAGSEIAILGKGQNEYFAGGGGSARITSVKPASLKEGLAACEKLSVNSELLAAYENSTDGIIPFEMLKRAADKGSTAVIIISRFAAEGRDEKDEPGSFQLTDDEKNLISDAKRAGFKRIAVLINAGNHIELEWAENDPAINSILFLGLGGMSGGHAAADLLTGDAVPGGRLTGTICRKCSDYPSYDNFCDRYFNIDYVEDIFVGYRYFSTVPGADKSVLYPFGYGLSYTTFEIEQKQFDYKDDKVLIWVRVTNTGNVPAREVVQLYACRRDGILEHPARELIDWSKTGVVDPGRSVDIFFTVDPQELRSFDDTGVCGVPGSWICDKGTIDFFCGKNARDAEFSGSVAFDDVLILESPGLLLTSRIPGALMHSDGSITAVTAEKFEELRNNERPPENSPEVIHKLADVEAGKITLDEFIEQFTAEELIKLCSGQPATLPDGTAGIGNLEKFGIPNIQTADGPAGVRLATGDIWLPCSTIAASTFDLQLLEEMGKALGNACIRSSVDILLAPGLNIQRDPRCGRNFEYYSEDPLVAGRCASAIVCGIQSCGIGATIKHFAANNREMMRKNCTSNISERALREIYLRGFEMTVKNASPWCIMTSYNYINGVKASCFPELLQNILRDEWGFDGLVMTDWNNEGPFWNELLTGSDLKMPVAPEKEITDCIRHIVIGPMPCATVKKRVRKVLQLVMKSRLWKMTNGKLS